MYYKGPFRWPFVITSTYPPIFLDKFDELREKEISLLRGMFHYDAFQRLVECLK